MAKISGLKSLLPVGLEGEMNQNLLQIASLYMMVEMYMDIKMKGFENTTLIYDDGDINGY